MKRSAPTSITQLSRSGQLQQNIIPRLSASSEGWNNYGAPPQEQQYYENAQPYQPPAAPANAYSFSGFTSNWSAPPQ